MQKAADHFVAVLGLTLHYPIVPACLCRARLSSCAAYLQAVFAQPQSEQGLLLIHNINVFLVFER